MERCRISYLLTRALVLVLLTLSACDMPNEVDLGEIEYNNPLKIGVLLPVSNERSAEESAYFATILAAEEINRAGGVLGRDIEIVFRDDAGIPDYGVEQAQKMHAEGIEFIVGPSWSSVTLAVAQRVTIPNGMLLVSHAATHPSITNLNDNNLVWRIAPSDVIQAKIGADYVYNVLNKRTVGIIYSSALYTVGLAEAFKASFEEIAGPNSVLSFVSFPELQDWSTYDFTPHLIELFADRPEVIYLASYTIDGAKITNDIFYGHYLNALYKPQFFSNDGPFGFDFIFNGHPDILNGMLGTQPTGDRADLNYLRFQNNYNQRFGFDPESFAEHIYDAVYLIAFSISKSGQATPQAAAAQLRQVSGGEPGIQGTVINVNEYARARTILEGGGDINYNGASGLIDFDENGDPGSGTYIIWKIQNKNYVVEETIKFP